METETGGTLSESLYGGTIYRIPGANLGELQSKLEKLNKKAAKLGTSPISLEVVETELKEEKIPGWTLANGEVMEWRTVAREYHHVIVHGETPTLNGWQFAATLIHDPEIGTAIHRVPTFGEDIDLSSYRTADPSNCDHCGLDRRRRDTFVVYNTETGETKQVGRQCVKDFLGFNDALAIAAQLERIREFVGSLSDEEYEGPSGMRGPAMESVEYYLTHVAAMIRLHGWKSRGMVEYTDETSTSDAAMYNISNYGQRDARGRKMYEDVIEEDAEVAKAAIEFNKAEWSNESSKEFEYNMALAFARDFFDIRNKGFVAYGVQAYLKNRTEQIEQEKAAKNPSEWQGTVGQREVFSGLTVTDERTLDNFHVTYLYTMLDGQGNIFKWFASSPSLEVGKTYNLKATVKKHDEWKGQKQTMINRATEV